MNCWLPGVATLLHPRWLAVTLFLAKAAYGQVAAAALDPAGNIWQAGRVNNALTCGSFAVPPGFQETVPCNDATVTKLDPTGSKVLFSATLGGNGDSGGLAITTDSAGNVYIAGYTTAPDFPVTSGALQTKNAGPYTSHPAGYSTGPEGDTFIVKLNPNGSVAYATFLGGSGDDVPVGIAVDSAGSVYVAGDTASTDFPLTSSPLSGTPGAGFVAKINPGGQSLNYSTYFPANITALAVDSGGAMYLTGIAYATLPTTAGSLQTTGGGDMDAFVSKINASGSGLVYSTYLGGSGTDSAFAIAVDSQGAAWVGGQTDSPTFPGTKGTGSAFLVKLSPGGSAIQTGSRFGTPEGYNSTIFVAVDARDNVYAFGEIDQSVGTFSVSGFQPTANAQLSIPCSPFGGNFLIESASDGTLLYASYVRRIGTIFVTAPGHLLIDSSFGAVAMDLTSTLAMNFQCPVNAAAYTVPATPGEIVSLFGTGIGPEAGVTAQPDASGRFPTLLAGVQVQFNGVAAPLLYVQAGQVNAVVPNQNLPGFLYTVEVSYQGQSAPVLDVGGEIANPGVFAVANQDGTLNSLANPAKPGSIVSVYATGMDMFGLDGADGQVMPLSPLLPINFSQNGDAVSFAGVPGTILWEGAAPNLIFGVVQINVLLPASLPPASSVTSVPMVVQSSYIDSSPAFPVFIAP